jgi:hypothetical protein
MPAGGQNERFWRSLAMGDLKIGEEVLLPDNRLATVQGMVILRGQMMVILAPVPTEILWEISTIEKYVSLEMVPEGKLRKVIECQ